MHTCDVHKCLDEHAYDVHAYGAHAHDMHAYHAIISCACNHAIADSMRGLVPVKLPHGTARPTSSEPLVRVPVLSNMMAVTREAFSRTSPPWKRMRMRVRVRVRGEGKP